MGWVRTPPQGAGAQSGLGCLLGAERAQGRPPRWGGGPQRSSELGGSCLQSAGREGCSGETAEQSPRARGARGAVGIRGSPRQCPSAGPRWGPLRSGSPWRGGGGRKRAEERREEERGSPARRAASGPEELRPLARGRRGGQEALALTSRGPAGDGGSGHSTPHRPPPAPADSGVRRHCARGGASQLRGRGSRREPGCCSGAPGGARVDGLTAGKSLRRQRCGGQGSGVPEAEARPLA